MNPTQYVRLFFRHVGTFLDDTTFSFIFYMETSEAVSNYRVDDAIVWGHVSDPSRVINQKAPTRDPESINTRNDRYYLYPGDFTRNHYSVLA